MNVFERLNKIVILILVTLLILSFGVWGIGDVIQGQTPDKIAKVGKTILKRSEFETILSSQIRRLSDSYDMQNENLRLIAEQRTLNNLINERLYKLEAEDMGILITNQQIKENIKNNTLYQKDGVFRKDIFKNYVRSTGLSEFDYIENVMKPEISEAILNEVLYDDTMLPKKMIDMLVNFDGETRIAKLLIIPKLFKKDIASPTNKELQEYFDNKKFAFQAPEYRKISIMEVSYSDIREDIDLSDKALKEEYEERITEFMTDEKRTVQMMTFNKKEDADAARKKVLDGGDFMKVAKEEGVSETSVNSLGTIVFADIEQNQFYPAQMADTIFNMKENEISEAQKSSRGWHFYKVLKIILGKPKKFDDIKMLIKMEKRKAKTVELLFNISNQIEDELAGGSTLEEIAKALNLKIRVIQAVSQDGSDMKGKAVANIPKYNQFLTKVFDADRGELSNLVTKKNGMAYSVFRVDGIIESRDRTLDEVRTKVLVAWKSEKAAEKTGKFAKEVSDDIKSGKDFDRKAKEIDLKVVITKKIYRSSSQQDKIPDALRRQLFDMKIGEATMPFQDAYGNYIIAKLDKINEADREDVNAGVVAITEKLTEDYKEEMKRQYIGEIQKKHPVTYFLENTAILQNIMQNPKMLEYIDKSKR